MNRHYVGLRVQGSNQRTVVVRNKEVASFLYKGSEGSVREVSVLVKGLTLLYIWRIGIRKYVLRNRRHQSQGSFLAN